MIALSRPHKMGPGTILPWEGEELMILVLPEELRAIGGFQGGRDTETLPLMV